MGMGTSEEGWVDVYETVDFDGDRVTLFSGDPGFEKSGKRHGLRRKQGH